MFNDADNESVLLETGCHMVLPLLKISDKANLLSLMIDYHCIIKPKAAIDQFVEGQFDWLYVYNSLSIVVISICTTCHVGIIIVIIASLTSWKQM